jgi:pyruvate-formate lyase
LTHDHRRLAQAARVDPWEGFPRGEWCESIDVRDFIQHAYSPYEGDAEFLTGPTERTRAVWDMLSAVMLEERATSGGVLDVDAATPSSITAHAPTATTSPGRLAAAARRSNGCTSATSGRSRSRTAPRCRSGAPRASSTATSSATSTPAR